MSSLKLEEGKFYRNGRGRKIGPMWHDPDNPRYPWSDGDGGTHDDSGAYWSDTPTDYDLVAEWVDEASDTYSAGPEDDLSNDEVIYCTPPCTSPARSAGPTPERVKILHDGAALTNGDRDEEYGPPANNMSCAGELKAVFRKWLARDIGPGELEALDMAMTKLSRLSCGKPKRDTYVDAATYIAIAGEIALTPTA